MTPNTTTLTVAGTGEVLTLTNPQLVVAGYTARDQEAVRAHVEELAAIGVEPPPHVPMYYPLGASLLTTSDAITVGGDRTSGEVEPIVVWCNGRRYLGVGSDHTDRHIETESVADSKAAAPKPIGTTVVPLDDAIKVWDEIRIVCRVDGEAYQEGTLASMLLPDQILAGLAELGAEPTGDAIMFCGTVPLLDGAFVYGDAWEMELQLPGNESIQLVYTVDVEA